MNRQMRQCDVCAKSLILRVLYNPLYNPFGFCTTRVQPGLAFEAFEACTA